MPTLNRFPLLALWAKEAARRIGYTVAESEALGHAYAVLYAIRAAGKPHKKEAPAKAAARKPAAPPPEQIEFGGDMIDVTRDAKGKVQGLVGHEEPQTAQSYRKTVPHKFPPGYYARLEEAFRLVFQDVKPGELNSRMIYDLYDNWKKSCGVGRLVDLDKLLAWCDKRVGGRQ
jgi:hypothetical protein